MILILAEKGAEPAGEAIAAALTSEYDLPCKPDLVQPGATLHKDPEWDDLLVIVFHSGALPDDAVKYIQAYRNAKPFGRPVIPVSVNLKISKPPEPVSGIHAAHYDGTPDAIARIVKRAGVFLGLALRPGTERIFIAYRASDGIALARAIYKRLEAEGFQGWMDIAKDAIDIGEDVQDEIRRSVDTAAMVLVVDTPDAPASKWMKVEIDMAIAQLVPVLPVVAAGERTSRFIPLQSLRRQVVIEEDDPDMQHLSDRGWGGIRSEIEQVLLSAFKRRLRILARAQKIFEANGYKWNVVDDRLRMYRAEKKKMPAVIVLSHCSVHDITYVPALRAYWNYVQSYKDIAGVNQKLCIYDRERVLSEPEMETLSSCMPDMNAILAHYNELELLVGTNFSTLRI